MQWGPGALCVVPATAVSTALSSNDLRPPCCCWRHLWLLLPVSLPTHTNVHVFLSRTPPGSTALELVSVPIHCIPSGARLNPSTRTSAPSLSLAGSESRASPLAHSSHWQCLRPGPTVTATRTVPQCKIVLAPFHSAPHCRSTPHSQCCRAPLAQGPPHPQ